MQDQKLESVKGEMGEVREENERLKLLLAQLVNEYQSLQMHFFDILQQDKQEAIKATEKNEESELLSFSVGMTSNGKPAMDDKKDSNIAEKITEDEDLDEGLALGLDIRFDPSSASAETRNIPSPESKLNEEGKEEEPRAIWPPSKALKTVITAGDNIDASPQARLKKARVSIRARCDSQTMNDGCHWRKYGQKIAKGNPCPRGYYRCTVSPSCPVRKQVQRCAEDMSILITTYEGTHNHPLPYSATAMASTTSAAASMLHSPSLNSLLTLDTAPIFSPTAAANNPLNFSSCQISRRQQLCFPNSSISTSNSHPTITLDLTAPSTSYHFGRFTSGFSSIPSKSLGSSLNFCPLQYSIPQSRWNTYKGYFNYGTLTHNRNQNGSTFNSGKQPTIQGHLHQPNYISNHPISHHPLPETIAAATKAITENSKFQSALAAALTTYLNNGVGGGGMVTGNQVGEDDGLNLKLGGDMYTSSPNGIGCASSRYLNVSSSSSANATQQGKLVLFPPSLPSPTASKSAYDPLSDRNNRLLECWKRHNSTTTVKESNLSESHPDAVNKGQTRM